MFTGEEMDLLVLTERIERAEAKTFALTCMIEALIATHPNRDALIGAWRTQRAEAEVLALRVSNDPDQCPTGLRELAEIRAALASLDDSLNVPPWRLPPA